MPLPDRVTKAAILGSTAGLPAAWRLALRERWLARHELGKVRRADLVIIGHPKSGNTWLKAMLSRIYQVRHGLPPSRLIGSDELALRHGSIPRLAATNAWYSYEGAVGRALDASGGEPALRRKPTVVLVRHPCDIAVSWYFQFTRRQSAAKQELINHAIAHPIDRRAISMWDFVRHSDIGLPSLIDYLNLWARRSQGLERALCVRYEDLRAEPGVWLRRIGELMGETFEAAEIEEAVRFASFENLRRLETQGFFRQGGFRLVDRRDPASFKTRRGKVEGYRDYFSPAQVEELEALVETKLSPALGYRREQAAPAETRRPADSWGA